MNLDKLQLFPNQATDHDETECVALSVADIAGNIDGQAYDPDFSYAFALKLMGVLPTTGGEDPLAGMQSAVCFGLLPAAEETFTALTVGELYVANFQNYTPTQCQEALQCVKKGVRNVLGQGDDFDSIKAALQAGNAVSMPMSWFSSFTAAGYGNIVTKNPDGTYTTTGGGTPTGILPTPSGTITSHNVAVYAVDKDNVTITIDGVEYLQIKPWLGKGWGRGGYALLNREICNTVCQGAYVFDPNATRWISILGVLVTRFPTVAPYLPQLLQSAPALPAANSNTPMETEPAAATPAAPTAAAETTAPVPTAANPDVLIDDWTVPANAKHNVRVLCDLAGLTFYQKDVITACITVESDFIITAEHQNKNAAGDVLSTDYGIVQINDYYHIGPGKDFPSAAYVLANPGECVKWMIGKYQAGEISEWVSFTSAAYLRFMPSVA